MIRREIRLMDGAAGWMPISQVEHARISAQLAEHCLGRFRTEGLGSIRREVLAAIAHHDDGWARWERSPRLDPELHRPLSFMELDPSEAIQIWTSSISAAAEVGPLASWMVAGHFFRLLKNSEHAHDDPRVADWLAATPLERAECLDAWLAMSPPLHTREAAAEALQWLWTFDEVSLWLCCNCPARGDELQSPKPTRTAGRETPIEMQLAAVGEGRATASPWRFDVASIEVEASGRLLPAARYTSPQEMLAAGEPHTIRWQFSQHAAS